MNSTTEVKICWPHPLGSSTAFSTERVRQCWVENSFGNIVMLTLFYSSHHTLSILHDTGYLNAALVNNSPVLHSCIMLTLIINHCSATKLSTGTALVHHEDNIAYGNMLSLHEKVITELSIFTCMIFHYLGHTRCCRSHRQTRTPGRTRQGMLCYTACRKVHSAPDISQVC